MTYALFEALVKRREEEERNQFVRSGMIIAATINSGFCRPDEPVEYTDFVPGMLSQKVDLNKLPPEEQAAKVMSMFSKRTYSKG